MPYLAGQDTFETDDVDSELEEIDLDELYENPENNVRTNVKEEIDGGEFSPEEIQYYKDLNELKEGFGTYTWRNGITFYSDDAITKAIKEDIENRIDIPSELDGYIEWDRLIKDYQSEWSTVDVAGVSFWYKD